MNHPVRYRVLGIDRGMALVVQHLSVYIEIVMFTFSVHSFGLLAAALGPNHKKLSVVKKWD